MQLNPAPAPPWASAWGGALCLIPASLLASGCTTLPDSTTHPTFAAHHETYAYTETHATVQQDTLTCGLACLVSVLGTWGVETNEAALSAAYPDHEHDGYTLEELKAFAEAHSLRAFVVQWNDDPRQRLEEQIRSGRPVICAVRVPWTMYGMHGLGVADAVYRRVELAHGAACQSFRRRVRLVGGPRARDGPARGIGEAALGAAPRSMGRPRVRGYSSRANKSRTDLHERAGVNAIAVTSSVLP